MFDERRVAQAAAFFLNQRGGRMSLLKLMKLLYLTDRESLSLYGRPLSGDEYYSLPNGPILSRTLDLIGGQVRSEDNGWEEWVSDKADHEVSLKRHIESLEDLDELSAADLKILADVWERFGRMTRWEICDYTHDKNNVPEWENPKGSRKKIEVASILRAVGRSDEQVQEDLNGLEARAGVRRLLDSLAL